MTKQSSGARARAEALVDTYIARHGAADLEGVTGLFDEAACLEDPVGTPVIRGRAAIREFYRTTHARQGRLVFERVGPVLVQGPELAVHVRARLEREPDASGTDVIYTIVLDADGRIRSLRAFF
jgi:steroid Delta-isomerase